MNKVNEISRYAFIPHELTIENQPELKVFSFNIMFGSYGMKSGVPVFGSAIYEPDLKTLYDDNEKMSLQYKNKYGDNSHVNIIFYKLIKRYEGSKFVNGTFIGSGEGDNWKTFFIHLTMLGLSVGEACKFSIIDKKNL